MCQQACTARGVYREARTARGVCREAHTAQGEAAVLPHDPTLSAVSSKTCSTGTVMYMEKLFLDGNQSTFWRFHLVRLHTINDIANKSQELCNMIAHVQ